MAFVVSLLTPFDSRGRVDLTRLRAHVLWLIAHGVDGFIAGGPPGEFLYLSDREREAVQRTVLDAARGKLVVPCTWDASPTTAAYLTGAAREQGAAAALVPPPLYYPLDDVALAAWYRSMSERGPLWAYSEVPATPSDISAALYAELLGAGVLSGLVDAGGDIWRVRRLAEQHPATVWVADDRLLAAARAIPQLAGVVSVLANVWPAFCLRVWRGEEGLGAALVDRAVRVRRAGGVRALKSLARMGARAPLVEPPDDALVGLPPPETP